MSCTVEHNDPFGGVYTDFLAAASHQDRPRHLVNGQLCMCVCVCVCVGGGGDVCSFEEIKVVQTAMNTFTVCISTPFPCFLCLLLSITERLKVSLGVSLS